MNQMTKEQQNDLYLRRSIKRIAKEKLSNYCAGIE